MGDYSLLIIVGFLFISLIVGLLHSRGVDTFKKFAVGNKNFKTSVLVATIAATVHDGGMLVRDIEAIYNRGLYYCIPYIFEGASFLFIGQFMALRMKEFLNHYSISESMGVLFGTPVRIITAICGIMLLSGFLAIQIKVITEIVEICIFVKKELCVYITLGIVLLYAMWGGIKSVTLTDVIQFITFSLLVIIIIFLVYQQIKPDKSIKLLFTTHENFKINEVIGWHPKFRDSIAIFLISTVPFVTPDVMQRFYMASDVWQARKMFCYAALVGWAISMVVIILGILLFIHNETLNPQNLVPYLMSLYPAYWFKGAICVGILALAMSTADSNLNTASVLFVHDIASLIKLPVKYKLWLARLFMVSMGIFALWLSAYKENFLSLLFAAFSFYMPIVTVPFVMAVFGFRPRSISVLIGMCAAGVTVGVNHCGLDSYLGITEEVSIILGMFMNLLFLFGSYYLLPKIPNTGWVGIKEKDPLIQAAQERKRKWKTLIDVIKNFNLDYYVRQFFPREKTVLCVGIYIFIVIVIQLFTFKNITLDFTCFVVPMIIGLLLVIYPTFYTDRLRNNIVITYSWPVLIGSLFYLLQGHLMHQYSYQVVPSCIFLINILVGIMLFPWSMVLSMVIVSFYILKNVIPCNVNVDMLTSLQGHWGGMGWNFSIVFFFFFIISIILIIYKQRFVSLLQKAIYLDQEKAIKIQEQLVHMQYQHHLDLFTMNKEESNVLQHITQELNVLLKNPHISSKEKRVIQNSLDRLVGYRDFIQERTYYERYHIPLNVSKVSLESLVNKVFDSFSLLQIQLKPLIHRHTSKEMIQCDPEKVVELLCMSVQWIHQQKKAGDEYIVKLYILDTMLRYTLNKHGTSYKDLSAVSFVITTMSQTPSILPLYDDLTTQIVPITFNTEQDLYRQRMLQIVDAHYGFSSNISESSGHTLLHVLPLELNDIRDEVMNTLPKFPDFKILETSASLQKEVEVTNLIVSKTLLNRTYVEETIAFIKKCHGDQLRQSGEPFYTHPLEVAAILLTETKDPAALLASLLHDVIEDSKVPLSYLRSQFGYEVAFIVNKVTHMDDSFRKKRLSKEENAVQLASYRDIRVIQVKLADRLHNVRTLTYRPLDKQLKVAQETLTFYVPLGEQVGVKLVQELKEQCEKVLSFGCTH